MRSMVTVYCDNPVQSARKILIYYQCEQSTTPSCRINICTDNSPRLTCTNGGVIHVQNIICKSEGVTCSWETYVTLYTLCEARSECSSSALQTLLPAYCEHNQLSLRNVLVDYICVKDSAIENVCSGTVRKLSSPQGLILSPGFIEPETLDFTHCYWSIDPSPSTMVNVIVHMAYHKDSMPQCGNEFLQIQFRNCNSGRTEKGSFCDIRKHNQEIISCGTVYISSTMPSVKPDFSDKFLISYQLSNHSSSPSFVSQSTEPCGVVTVPSTTSPSSLDVHDTIYYHDNTIINTVDKPQENVEDSGLEPYDIIEKLKMMFLYIFFGLIIVALIISLVMVIVSYKRVGKRTITRRDFSEKAVLWNKDEPPPHVGDTPLETFRHNSVAETTVSGQTTETADVTVNHYDVLVPTQSPENTIIATIHLNSDNDKRLSAGSGFSSFRPSNRNSEISSINPYASYSSLNSNNSPQYYGRHAAPTNGTAVQNNGDSQKRYVSPVRNPERQPLFRHSVSPLNPDDVDHFTVNEDDYAIVKKTSRKPNSKTKELNPVDDLEPTYDNVYDSDIRRFRPTSGPYDKNRTSNSEISFQFKPPNHLDEDL